MVYYDGDNNRDISGNGIRGQKPVKYYGHKEYK